MQTQTLDIHSGAPGVRQLLSVLRFGSPGRGPKACIQAALHADEVPAMLVASVLRQRLTALEAAGDMFGEVVLVPYANPLGLAQHVLGQHQGRFDLRDGLNFNRHYADLTAAVASAVGSRLSHDAGQDAGHDAGKNTALIRDALRAAAMALHSLQPAQDLKNRLLQTAIDSDIVLDLHCDGEASMHLYALTQHEPLARELGALLGAQAVLLASESGDSPFDEACSQPWLNLQKLYPDKNIPLACFSSTIELRGEADTSHALAAQDADAIIEFLRRRGVVAGEPAPLPAALCEPTPLAGSEPITAPHAGIVVFHHAPGAWVEAGSVIADLIDVDSGEVTTLCTQSAGRLYARVATRWATPGKRLAKVAGTSLARTGKLLSP